MTIEKMPSITLTSIGSGRKVKLDKIGTPAVLIFHGRNTSEAARTVNGPVRDRYPDASRLLVASVADLHSVPRLLRGVVEAFISDAYEEASQELPEGWKSYDYLLILPDWDGKVTRAVGLDHTDRTAGVVVLDSQGNITGVYQGRDLIGQTLVLLNKIGIEG